MNHKKHWKLTALAALSLFFVGAGVAGLDATAAKAEETAANVVSVTIGDQTTEYADFASAMEATNGQESAKVTLLADVDGKNVSYNVKTEITLDLAGYALSDASLPTSGNAALVIEDSSEKKTGEVFPRAGIAFSTIHSGFVTINGGIFYSVGLTIVSGNTNGSITVNGDTFKGYVRLAAETGTVTVNDGTFESAILHDQGGEISVKGGEFTGIEARSTNDDLLFADYIADGYALKDSAGEYVDIYNRVIVGNTSVVEHTCDLTDTQYDETNHWMGCDCYRKPADSVEEAHTIEPKYDRSGHWDGCDCGYAIGFETHVLELKSDENGDWAECACSSEHYTVSVTANDQTAYYADFASAIEAANKQESAQLTLLVDVDGKDGAYTVETEITLDVAGNTLSGADLVLSDENGALILEDTGDEQTGKIIGILGSTFCTMYGGSLTVNSGNFEGIGFHLTQFAPNESFIEINGGTFDQLTVITEVGKATLNDFTATEILLYNYNGGIEIKGGTFQYADINEATVQDCLADGYKIVDQDGVFVDYDGDKVGALDWDSENGETIYLETLTVVEHKTCEYETQFDDDSHWTACDCGATEDGEEAVKEAHKGGTATCISQAVCEVCEQSYGELGDHVADVYWHKDDTHHWKGCVYGVEGGWCEETFEYGEHVDDDGDDACDACGVEIKTSKKGGCGSSVATSGLAVVLAMAIGVVVRKRKKES